MGRRWAAHAGCEVRGGAYRRPALHAQAVQTGTTGFKMAGCQWAPSEGGTTHCRNPPTDRSPPRWRQRHQTGLAGCAVQWAAAACADGSPRHRPARPPPPAAAAACPQGGVLLPRRDALRPGLGGRAGSSQREAPAWAMAPRQGQLRLQHVQPAGHTCRLLLLLPASALPARTSASCCQVGRARAGPGSMAHAPLARAPGRALPQRFPLVCRRRQPPPLAAADRA